MLVPNTADESVQPGALRLPFGQFDIVFSVAGAVDIIVHGASVFPALVRIVEPALSISHRSSHHALREVITCSPPFDRIPRGSAS